MDPQRIQTAAVRNGTLQAALAVAGAAALVWLAVVWFTAATARHESAMTQDRERELLKFRAAEAAKPR